MRKKFLRLVRLAPLALAFVAGAAHAQTTGTIIGVVTDASTGKPVPDALVVATSPNLQGEQTALTDDTGNFRITLLPSGRYKLSVQREGFKPAERTDVEVHLDKTIKANLAVVPEAVTLDVTTVNTGAAPVINVGTAETGATVSKEFMANVPVGRDFSSVALVAPGAQGDSYGVSFNGSSSPENNYIMDGMNVTDPAFGIQGSSLLPNFVEEVDVKSGAFMPEYGRATGGVINVVTKSGSNEYHGSVFGNLTPGALSPSAKSIGRDAEAVASEVVESKGYRTDFGGEVGGPIMKDRLWFYVGFAPVLAHSVVNRYIQALQQDPATGGAKVDPTTGLTVGTRLAGTDKAYNSDVHEYQFTSKLTYLLNENNNITLSFYADPTSANQSGSMNAAESQRQLAFAQNSTDLIARYAGKLLNKHLIVEAQGGWHHQTSEDQPTTVGGIDQGSTSGVRWDLRHNLGDFEAVPAECNPTPTFTPCPVTRYLTGGWSLVDKVALDRFSGKLAVSGLFSGAGHHNVKAGIDIERNSYDHTKHYSGTTFLREVNSGTFGQVFQDYRQYGTVNPNDPNQPLIYDSVHAASITNSRAFYLQDSWSILDILTVNGGLRWETQDMFEAGASGPANLSISDNIGPRVQAIYDFTGQGRSKISANWGRFYEAIPLDLADRSFHADSQVVDLRQHCVSASPNVGGTPATCEIIPKGVLDPSTGQFVTYRYIAAQDAVPVAPDLKGQFKDMFGANIEYEVITDLSVGLTYTGTRLSRVIEDMSTDDGAHYFIANPGESKQFKDPSGATLDPQKATATDPVTLRQYQAKEPAPIEKYDGITLELRKNFSKHWLAQASYTYSSYRGNYGGLFRAENGQLDPNILSEYDLVSLLPNKYGPLAGDSPHQFKLYGSYIYDLSSRMNIVAGGSFRAHSGTPINYLGAHPDYGPGEAYVLPRGSAGRTPMLTSLDIKAGLEYVVTPPYTVRFSVDIFNLLNSQQTVTVDNNYTYDSVKPIENGQCKNGNAAEGTGNLAQQAITDCPDLAFLKTTDGRAVTVNKNWGKPTSYQSPLAVRFGLTFTF